MQLPSIIRDPAVALISETCYISLVENLNIHDKACIKYAISKGLGLGIVLGGSIVKVPQILTILRNHSAQGLSNTSYLLETFSYLITLSYHLRSGNPFSTFGEILFICLQNVIILSLMFFYGRQMSSLIGTLVGLGSLFWALNNNMLISQVMMNTLYAITIPLSLASKVPQIWTNFQNKSTGQLSVFTVVNYLAGSAARVFTTMTELDDTLMLVGNVLAAVFNAILVLQVALYWNGANKKKRQATKLD